MAMPKIILIAGFAQHGKDASASILKNMLEEDGKKVFLIRYGDYLKTVARDRYGWNGLKDCYGRNLLQVIGTELARDNNPDIWVNVVIETVKALATDCDYVIIPDFRYLNEHYRWVDNGYSTLSIWVHRNDFDNGMTPEQKNHRSETSLLDFQFNYIISVESKMEKLVDAVRRLKEGFNL